MKIKFDCPKCHREWTSAYGNTQWFYKLDEKTKETGGFLGCALFFKVHTYGQRCEKCNSWGQLNPYDDEYDRLAKVFVNHLAKQMNRNEPFPEKAQKRSNMKRKHQSSRCGACAAGVCFAKGLKGRSA